MKPIDAKQTYVGQKLNSVLDFVNSAGIEQVLHGDNAGSIDAACVNPLLQASQIQGSHGSSMSRCETASRGPTGW